MALHWYDLLPLVVVALLIFGPKRLPEMGASVGKTIKAFQHSMREATNEPETPPTPPKASAITAAPETPALPEAKSATTTAESQTSELAVGDHAN